jgi:hypothetical protein
MVPFLRFTTTQKWLAQPHREMLLHYRDVVNSITQAELN